MAGQSAKERVGRLASRQFGRVSWAQLRELRIPSSTRERWISTGYLHHVLPGVYAVGHRAQATEADLMSAVLYAGPGAMLSHGTAAWWVGLTKSRPHMIELSAPRRCRSHPGVRVHERRRLERVGHRGLPMTTLAQTLIDLASRATLTELRRALAQADYQGALNLEAIQNALRSGCPESAKLRRALARHQPMLARANSGLEVAFFELCERYRLPVPELNARIAGWEVDALWRRERVAVELDGPGNHRTPAQIRRDRRKEHELRIAGLAVLRYSDEQIDVRPAAVAAEVQQNLTLPVPSA